MPSDWDALSYKISKNATDLSSIRSALKPIVVDRVDNLRRLVDNQIDKIEALQSDLFAATKQIDKFASADYKEVQDLIETFDKQRESLREFYENKLKKQNAELQKLQKENKELKKKLDSQTPKPPPPQQSPPKPPPKNDKKPSPPNESKPVESTEEAIAKTLVSEGRNAFDSRNFEQAERHFTKAKVRIESLPREKRKRFNLDEIEYYLAVCGVFDPGFALADKVKRIVDFLDATRHSQSLDRIQLAHTNHLLAQLYVQQGDLSSAETFCKVTSEYTSKLAVDDPTDQRQYEQAGLSIRINELNKEDEVVLNAIAKGIPRPWRAWFTQRYSSLQPKSSPKQPSNPLRPEPPEGVKPAATWLVPPLSFKAQKPNQPTAPTPPVPEVPDQRRRVIDRPTRIQWLTKLELRETDDSFQNAIIDGDLSMIKSLVRGLPSWKSPPDTALHVAALFDEVVIAQCLIDAGAQVHQSCTIARLRKEKGQLHSYGITPMHVAIGAQQHGMIRLLKENGASLKVPDGSGLRNRPTAAPRFLLSEGWLELIECENPKDIAKTLDVLESLGWSIDARLNSKGSTLADYAADLKYNVPGFQSAVQKDIKRRRA